MGRKRIHKQVRIRRRVDPKIEVRAASAYARRERMLAFRRMQSAASAQLRLLQTAEPPPVEMST